MNAWLILATAACLAWLAVIGSLAYRDHRRWKAGPRIVHKGATIEWARSLNAEVRAERQRAAYVTYAANVLREM